MSFKQDNYKKKVEAKKWQAFYEGNLELIKSIGLPLSTTDTLERFYDFLMHGCIDHHDDPFHFTVDQLSPEKRSLLRQLIYNYFEVGLSDPGMGSELVGGEKEYNKLVMTYPNSFLPAIVRGITDQPLP